MYFDGGSLPNPGHTAGAFVIYDPNQNIVGKGGKYITHGTNNIGEYNGLLFGLEYCIQNNIKNVHIRGDSKLVVSQVSKVWKINHDHLRDLNQKIQKCLESFDYVCIEHVLRDKNKVADQLSDLTLAKKETWVN